MEFYDAVYHAAWKKGMTIEKLSLSLGRTANYIGAAKSRGSQPKVDTAVKILNACDYTLCAIPNGKVPEDAIEIGLPEE